MNCIFQIEEIIGQLFDEVCPPVGSKSRALKPLLAPVLGQLMPDHNVRRLVTNREYCRVDFSDFADYATSTLAPNPVLGDYADNQALLYEGIERHPEEPLFTTNWSGRDFGLSLLDAVIARHKVFVSVTTRFLVYRDSRSTYKQQYGELDPDDVAGATVLTTQIFAAKPLSGIDSLDDTVLNKQLLEEWDRYYVLLPVPSDLEWRFALSGTYTDYFLDQCLQNPGRPGGLTPDQIQRVRKTGRENGTEHSVEFELGSLALALPHYVGFMYDLVGDKKVPVRQTTQRRNRRRVETQAQDDSRVKYRIIRSVNVIRPKAGLGKKPFRRSWSPPSHSYAVRGHWRTLGDTDRAGHDQCGKRVQGKTWVRDHEKGYTGQYPFPTTSETRSSSVVINIKEPLSYGRDVIQSADSIASQRDDETPQCTSVRGADTTTTAPSLEWRAQERAKLTFQFRYFILRRDHYRCCLCGRSAADENGIKLHVDHKVPIEQWGRTVETNLWTLCSDCNQGKGVHKL